LEDNLLNFTDQQISKWAQDYEKEICSKYDLICDRWSLVVIPGQSEYEIPNYVTNIRGVIYLGKELHPKSGRTSIITGDTPFSTSRGVPYEYMFTNKGLRVLKFYPSPGDAIPTYVGNLFTTEADKDGCIVEFYRTSNDQNQLPLWLRRYLLKDYICWKAFTSEGPNQDLRASLYYEPKRQKNEEYIMEIKSLMFQSYTNILGTYKTRARKKPGHPVLPMNFGIPS